jgi:RNA polymerase sigma factor (sigma-70 family)
MSIGPLTRVLGGLRRTAYLQEAANLTDGELLECYVTQRDETAFEALVRRHGPMVLGVCRRILKNPEDAEDAFQATFLVLARKAGSIVPREKVGSWLYGAACLAAQKARAVALRRRVRERQVSEMPEPATVAEGLWHDLEPLLDQELTRLPDKYRLPVVLCHLEGKTRKQAAQQLGWPIGTVAGRLARGRAMLAKRLTRRGLPLSGAVLGAVLSQNAATAQAAGVPVPLVLSTVKAAALAVAGQTAAGSIVPQQVTAIAEGVMKVMLVARLKIVFIWVLLFGIVCLGAGLLAHHALAAKEERLTRKEEAKKELPRKPAPPNTLTVKNLVLSAVDAAQGTISATVRAKPVTMKLRLRLNGTGKVVVGNVKLQRQGKSKLEALPVARGARILVKNKPAKLADLKAGMPVTLELGMDGEQIVVKSIKVD